MIGFGLVVLRRFSGYYDFTVSQTRVGLQVRRGLFDRTTQTITLARVQGVVVSEPVLWRRFGWAKLDVSVAGSGGTSEHDGGPSATTVMPVADLAVVHALASHLLSGHDADVDADLTAIELKSPPSRARWLDPFGRRFMGVGMGDDLVVSRQGWFTRSTHAVRHARVQSVRLSQGPLQRRLGLADVHVDSPPGPVQVRARHRAAPEARRLWEAEQQNAKGARASRP
jgi:putative membrane protein